MGSSDPESIGSYDLHKNLWFSPHLVIAAFGKLARLYGNNVSSKREFKIAREMFEGAVALLGAFEMHPDNKYVLQPNLQSGSPDLIAVKQTEVPNSQILLEITQLEIVNMNDYSHTNDIVEFLKNTKLSPKKSYGKKTLIICVVNKEIPVEQLKIAEELERLKPKSTIYILGKLPGDNDRWSIFSPYPKLVKFVIYGLSETMKKYQLPSVLRLHIGTARKISYEKVHPEISTIYDIFNIEEARVEKYRIN